MLCGFPRSAITSSEQRAILRWHDTDVGRPTGAPAAIERLPDDRETTAPSEGKRTGFQDWSHPGWRIGFETGDDVESP